MNVANQNYGFGCFGVKYFPKKCFRKFPTVGAIEKPGH